MPTPRYAVRADVERAAGGAAQLVQIADHDADGVEDTGLVDEYLCDAEALVDSYWRCRYERSPDPVPRVLMRITAKLTVYKLKADAAHGATISEFEQNEHEEHLNWLSDLAAGKVDPGVSPTPARSPRNRQARSEQPTTNRTRREAFKGFV